MGAGKSGLVRLANGLADLRSATNDTLLNPEETSAGNGS
jgi:ABC-type methionine transport system ATPase subunit